MFREEGRDGRPGGAVVEEQEVAALEERQPGAGMAQVRRWALAGGAIRS